MATDRSSPWYGLQKTGIALGRKLLNEMAHEMAVHSQLGDVPVFDTSNVLWTAGMEAKFHAVRAELDEVMRDREHIPTFQDISPDQAHLAERDHWHTFFFYGYGYRGDENCERCPVTTRLLEAIPGMKTAFFSILAPHTHVAPHRGPYKGVLRYHLGLKVPEPDLCRIRVDNQILHWREGKSLLFDDTYEHEVWNDSDQERVVLFVDVMRPLPWYWSLGNEALVKAVGMSPLVQEGVRNFRRLSGQAHDVH